MTTDVWIKKIGDHRGAPRVYLDGLQAVRAGFTAGERFDIEVDGKRVVLSRNKDGSRTVSSKRRGDRASPVIDINSKELLALFEGMDSIRVVVGPDRVYLLPLASEIKKVERLGRLRRKVAGGEPLAVGSLSHGGGILSHAIHRGLKDAGIAADLKFVNELRDDLVEQAIATNDAWSSTTSALVMPMQEVVQDDWIMSSLPLLEILEMGLPCSGATRAGIAKRSLEIMESHPEVGHLVFAALVILTKTQPAIALFENVELYSASASAQILRQQLRDMGYTCHEAILEGRDFGALEDRVRWCMVATTRGVDFSFADLAPKVRIVRELGEVLDQSIGPDDSRWREYGYLKEKAARDKADGKGFKVQAVTAASTSVPTLRKGYFKGGTTDPLLRHPTDPALLRKFTPPEHARIKGCPEHLVAGLSETVAHQLLGQGVVYEPFRAVGKRIGAAVLAVIAERRQTMAGRSDASAAAERGTGADNCGPEDISSVSLRRQRMTG